MNLPTEVSLCDSSNCYLYNSLQVLFVLSKLVWFFIKFGISCEYFGRC